MTYGVTKRGSTLQLDTCEWRHRSLLDWTVELIVAESYSEVQSYVLLKQRAEPILILSIAVIRLAKRGACKC